MTLKRGVGGKKGGGRVVMEADEMGGRVDDVGADDDGSEKIIGKAVWLSLLSNVYCVTYCLVLNWGQASRRGLEGTNLLDE